MKILNTLTLSITTIMFANGCLAIEQPVITKTKIVPDIQTTNTIIHKPIDHAEINTRAWQKSGIAMPIKTNNGTIKYPFGESTPTITCSPLHVCDIELEAGEKILNVAIGDQVRWLTSPANSGEGSKIAPHVIVKPTDENISTNMVVTTDKRTYYLFLTSKKTGYITRLSFYYPNDLVQKWNQAANNLKEQESQKIAEFPLTSAEKLDFNYDITGNNKRLKPARVLMMVSMFTCK